MLYDITTTPGPVLKCRNALMWHNSDQKDRRKDLRVTLPSSVNADTNQLPTFVSEASRTDSLGR